MQKLDIGQKILSENDRWAQENSRLLAERRLTCFNVISSPGSGKTTVLVRTIQEMMGRMRIGVIEGDIQTDLDAQRVRATGAPAIQINTQGACHLSAAQVNGALGQLPLDRLDLIFIENVGNLVCPGAFELGEHGKIVVLSVAEGDDKPAKYPGIFAKAMAMLINKVDLLPTGAVDFDLARATDDARRLNREVPVFPVSARTGEGLEPWCQWLQQSVVRQREARSKK
jgi:hydrogenase nickel incorporation protein HypB